MSQTVIPKIRICSTQPQQALSTWASILLVFILIIALRPPFLILKDYLWTVLGKSGLIIAVGLLGLVWMLYELIKPRLNLLWPQSHYVFDHQKRTLHSEWHNAYFLLSQSKAKPVQEYEFLYADHHENHPTETGVIPYYGDIYLFSYRHPQIHLCTVGGSHDDLMQVAQELATLIGLPCKDYSKMM